ncbi:Daunorubicin/doxorubicin resistance ATP-binding protein DrrA [Anaerococcus prevotii]|uniref:ABC transporter related n=1 Tax=Anaerococcus prevotii (strain ATCC 9321 / DSM 20548 / JCM 6508 / NCTC 11806 / PC1) TaxID=525919 RepID=C7RFI3_ANAPD|nr:ABC transporter ATP-binding protein [Anaerococcus prevotii]ACV28244.1 ABC transporter related [Anaerococcus prevotii DSM 20548]SUU93798.1 Daunorubicin/doxorubicin resistance ATP-binding protein DrrA [Anaerococcus prevotii]
MNDILSLRQVEKQFDNFHLGPLDLDIKRGSVLGLIGENGAGKSTSIRLILSNIEEKEGEIYIFGKKKKDLTENERKKIAFVFDDLYLPQDMNLRQVEKFHSLFFGSLWESNMFWNLVEKFDLPKDKDLKLFSRGMQMKTSLILALSHNADLLILDEATSGLDPIARDDILDLLLDFIQDENKSILISSHILSDLEKIADEIAFIHKGKIIFLENKEDLKEKYGIATLSKDEFESLDKRAIVGVRKHSFGIECLIEKSLVPEGLDMDKARIEDIMVFMIKEKYNESLDI